VRCQIKIFLRIPVLSCLGHKPGLKSALPCSFFSTGGLARPPRPGNASRFNSSRDPSSDPGGCHNDLSGERGKADLPGGPLPASGRAGEARMRQMGYYDMPVSREPIVGYSAPTKGSLREMLASLNISLDLKALALAQHQVQIILPFMPFERPPILRPGTLCPEVTSSTNPGSSLVFVMLPIFVEVPPPQLFPCRTKKAILSAR